MHGAPELAARARRERMSCVPKLPTYYFRELIFDVFPLV